MIYRNLVIPDGSNYTVQFFIKNNLAYDITDIDLAASLEFVSRESLFKSVSIELERYSIASGELILVDINLSTNEISNETQEELHKSFNADIDLDFKFEWENDKGEAK